MFDRAVAFEPAGDEPAFTRELVRMGSLVALERSDRRVNSESVRSDLLAGEP